jgi:hypothetical protein
MKRRHGRRSGAPARLMLADCCRLTRLRGTVRGAFMRLLATPTLWLQNASGCVRRDENVSQFVGQRFRCDDVGHHDSGVSENADVAEDNMTSCNFIVSFSAARLSCFKTPSGHALPNGHCLKATFHLLIHPTHHVLTTTAIFGVARFED